VPFSFGVRATAVGVPEVFTLVFSSFPPLTIRMTVTAAAAASASTPTNAGMPPQLRSGIEGEAGGDEARRASPSALASDGGNSKGPISALFPLGLAAAGFRVVDRLVGGFRVVDFAAVLRAVEPLRLRGAVALAPPLARTGLRA